MLKFTYTETGLHLEHLTQSLEAWMALRVILALRLNQPLCVEHCTASFLLRADLTELHRLTAAIDRTAAGTVVPCDGEYVEVSLRGVWVTSHPEHTEGMFLARLSDRTEFLVYQLWQASQTVTSSRGR
jgi:hypothetical protein